MATSPTDQNNKTVVDRLDRLKSSVRTAGGQGGPAAFRPESRLPARNPGDSDGDSDGGRQDPFEDGGDAEGEPQDPEKIQALPDASVPLGLIANLAISSSKAKAKTRGNSADAGSDGDQDDDNVVSPGVAWLLVDC